MTEFEIKIYLYASFIIGTPLGICVMIFWYRKVSKKLYKSIEKSRTVNEIAVKSLFYNLPSLILFLLLHVPGLYFGYLLKQHDFCKNMLEFNQNNTAGFDANHPDFLEKCGCFDINELMNESK